MMLDTFPFDCIEWTDYYHENARVPRINPGVQYFKINPDAYGSTTSYIRTMNYEVRFPKERPWWKFLVKK